ncbi:MAG: DctP family TRAP transporter solute-binding subunit [Bacillota bacterium]
MRRQGLGVLLFLLLIAAGCAPPAAVDHEQISPTERLVARFSHVTAENSPKHLAAVRFSEAVKKRTDQHIEIQVYPNSQLYRDVEEFGALQEGAIQFIAVAPSKLVPFDAAWQIFDLPYLFTDFGDVKRLFDSPLIHQMRKRLESKGLVVLEIWPNGFMQITNQRRPLVRPEDFQGLTFRVQAGPVLPDLYTSVGARAVVTSFTAIYAELERGNIDGQENTLNNIYTRNLPEVQPYLTLSDHTYLSYVVVTQARWWNSLSDHQREDLQSGLQEATQWLRENARAINEDALDKIVASRRVQVTRLTETEREALRLAFQPVYEATANRLGSYFVEQVLAVIGRK